VELVSGAFFNEVHASAPAEARPVIRTLAERGILGGVRWGASTPRRRGAPERPCIAVTETVTNEDVEALAGALEETMA
jgi:glycine dehydrogenase subunit 1